MANKFKIGDFVKVKNGIKDPDYDFIFTENCQGEITEIDGTLLTIEFDNKTVTDFPLDYLIQIIKDGAEGNEMCLETDDVELTSERDWTDREEQIASVRLYWIWRFRDDSSKYLNYFSEVDVDDEYEIYYTWINYLNEKLQFPLETEVVESDSGGLKLGEKVKLLDIEEDVDERYGVLGIGKSQKGAVTYPICDLEVIDKNSKNFQPLKDYCIWFANR